eukprot:m.37646 g.37646  ORF g.37646 m.37646 type:complete len:734 (+) comp17732_c0_seq1:216-2417(+)
MEGEWSDEDDWKDPQAMRKKPRKSTSCSKRKQQFSSLERTTPLKQRQLNHQEHVQNKPPKTPRHVPNQHLRAHEPPVNAVSPFSVPQKLQVPTIAKKKHLPNTTSDQTIGISCASTIDCDINTERAAFDDQQCSIVGFDDLDELFDGSPCDENNFTNANLNNDDPITDSVHTVSVPSNNNGSNNNNNDDDWCDFDGSPNDIDIDNYIANYENNDECNIVNATVNFTSHQPTKMSNESSLATHACGRCPICQMPFEVFSDVALDTHVEECARDFKSAPMECPQGNRCKHDTQNHFKMYSHHELAEYNAHISIVNPKHDLPTNTANVNHTNSNDHMDQQSVLTSFFASTTDKKSKKKIPAPTKKVDSFAMLMSAQKKNFAVAKPGMKHKCPFYKFVFSSNITVDAFRYGAVPGCSAYFLTHFHSDHYGGITKKFQGRVFCSDGTANLVHGILRLPRSQLYPIKMETPTMVNGVKCEFICANHCPSAVIILFTFPDGKTALHTGDFRATPEMAQHPLILGKRIDLLYLDTTYCDSQYVFPPQHQVIAQVVNDVKAYMAINPNALIIVGAYSIGKERIFLALGKLLNCKVCVSKRRMEMLRMGAPEMLSQLTLAGNTSRVHVLSIQHLNYKQLKSYFDDNKMFLPRNVSCVLAIKPTGWSHTMASTKLNLKKPAKHGSVVITAVPYSEHSSFSELEAFVRSIRPKRIIPTVNMGTVQSRAKMETYFKQWTSSSSSTN